MVDNLSRNSIPRTVIMKKQNKINESVHENNETKHINIAKKYPCFRNENQLSFYFYELFCFPKVSQVAVYITDQYLFELLVCVMCRFYCCFSFFPQAVSYVTQAGLELTMQSRMILNSRSSCLYLLSAGIIRALLLCQALASIL